MQSRDALSVREYLLVVVQLALLVVLVWQFHLEERRRLLACVSLAAGGFAIHALLPHRARLAAFLLLSVGSVMLVLGPLQAGKALGVGGVLIAVTFLPFALRWRVALVVLLAGGLVWMRSGSSDAFWPIVGSMFMFRMIVYLHATGRERRPASPLQACSYFFLLPNAFFPLFPVIDFRTFRDSYFNAERRTIYQTGVHWMAVGIAHLLLYRLIKYEILPTPLEVRSLRGVALFLVANYGLYLRVSGQFHLACGVVHLFGFHLPRTHDWFFLASSFSDIWRRINIYWKDFLQNLVFFPAFFRLRAGGDVTGVVLAVLCVFVCTWVGHSWQVFWLLGDFPLRREDALMWVGVGVVVAGSAALDYRRAARRGAGARVAGAGRPAEAPFRITLALLRVLKIVGVFVCVSLFWAHWTNPEVFRYLMYSGARMPVTSRDVLASGGAVGAAIVIGVGVQFARRRHLHRTPVGHTSPKREQGELLRLGSNPSLARRAGVVGQLSFERSVALHLVPLIALLLLAQPPVRVRFGEKAARIIATLQTERVTGAEALALIDGYYEQLSDGGRQSGPFVGDVAAGRPQVAVDFSDMIRYREDLLELELIPNYRGTFAGKTHTINRWGMRDRDRTLAKPEGTTRIALVGSSLVMGFGVGDDETFAALLEERLNSGALRVGAMREGEAPAEPSEGASTITGGSAGASPSPPGNGPAARRYEVLNFGVGRYAPIHRRLQIEHKVLPFDPDLILYFAHQDEFYTSARRVANGVYHRLDLEDPCLNEVIASARIADRTSEAMLQGAVEQYQGAILNCTYRRMAESCRAAGAKLVYVYLAIPGEHDLSFDPRICVSFADRAGIDTIDLEAWWGERPADDVLIGPIDYHPNPLGHRLLGDALATIVIDRFTTWFGPAFQRTASD
jgi:D-alanyl-lipoteichoic acid acyltransferase DltB (MBOAT superfamily)